MTSALVCPDRSADSSLEADLHAAGLTVLGPVAGCNNLVQDVVRYSPDVLICELAHPNAAFFEAIRTIALTSPCPVVVFTADRDDVNITAAMASGIHAYVIEGYAPHRLPYVLQVARARFLHESGLVKALEAFQAVLKSARWLTAPKTSARPSTRPACTSSNYLSVHAPTPSGSLANLGAWHLK